MCRFFWGQKHDKVYWVAWKKLCAPKIEGGLGLRGITSFNKFMLGKQEWRLLKNPDTLLARTLKARYYRHSIFLMAHDGYNPSFTWRSILDERELLKMGLVWVLGNCQDVRVWGDPWVSTRESRVLPVPTFPINEPFMVRDFLLDDYSGWDESILGALFNQEVKESILSVPLGRLNRPDHLAWKFQRDGIYSVKSAYRAWVTGGFPDQVVVTGASGSGVLTDAAGNGEVPGCWWSWVWRLKIAPEIQVFLWRCFKNVLPVCSNLIGRYVDVDPLCKRCGTEVETMEHALRDCVWVQGFWSTSPLQADLQLPSDETKTLSAWIIDLSENLSSGNQQFFVVLLWCLWFARNKFYFEDKMLDAPFVHAMGLSFLDEYSRANVLRMRVFDSAADNLVWFPPAPGYLKINVDAAVHCGRENGVGGVARDEGGLVRWCFAEKYLGRMEVERRRSAGALKGPKPNISLFGSLVNKILELRSEFDDLKFSWIRRVGNSVAHNLVSLAFSLEEPLFSGSLPDLFSCFFFGGAYVFRVLIGFIS
ncbi:hypothetical protein ACS0TY_004655 [Phlomoides rotata]